MGETIQCEGKLIGLAHSRMTPVPDIVTKDDTVVLVFKVKGERLEIGISEECAGFALRTLQQWANKRKSMEHRKSRRERRRARLDGAQQ